MVLSDGGAVDGDTCYQVAWKLLLTSDDRDVRSLPEVSPIPPLQAACNTPFHTKWRSVSFLCQESDRNPRELFGGFGTLQLMKETSGAAGREERGADNDQ